MKALHFSVENSFRIISSDFWHFRKSGNLQFPNARAFASFPWSVFGLVWHRTLNEQFRRRITLNIQISLKNLEFKIIFTCTGRSEESSESESLVRKSLLIPIIMFRQQQLLQSVSIKHACWAMDHARSVVKFWWKTQNAVAKQMLHLDGGPPCHWLSVCQPSGGKRSWCSRPEWNAQSQPRFLCKNLQSGLI